MQIWNDSTPLIEENGTHPLTFYGPRFTAESVRHPIGPALQAGPILAFKQIPPHHGESMPQRPLLTSRRSILLGVVGAALLPIGGALATDRKLAPFSLLDFSGQRVDVGEWLGRDVLMVVFWASWCTCCLEELPRLEALRKEYAERGFRLIAINIDPPNQQTRAATLMKRMRFGGAALMDPEGKVVDTYNKLKKTPTSLIVDRHGVIRRTVIGAPPGTDEELRALLEPLLELEPDPR